MLSSATNNIRNGDRAIYIITSLRAGQPRNRGLISSRGKHYFSYLMSPGWFWVHPTSYSNGKAFSFPGGKVDGARLTTQILFFLLWCCDPTRVMASSILRFLDHTQRRTTVGSTPLDEWSARRRDLHLTTHNTHNRQTPMPPVGFEPTISASERSQTYALDRAATGTG